MTGAAPGRVLRLAIAGWGLGHLALGDSMRGGAWLVAEAVGLLLVAVSTYLLAATTWYLVPFLAGMAFIAAWGGQAVAAYHRAQHRQGAIAPAARRSPAAAAVWLTVPLLVWGTGFWVVAGDAATPSAALDRFVQAWPASGVTGAERFPADLADDRDALAVAADTSLDRLARLCDEGELGPDCATSPGDLLRDVRIRFTSQDGEHATAVAELVRYERRASRFLWVFDASELVPVPIARILRLELAAEPASLGARRWTIVNATPL